MSGIYQAVTLSKLQSIHDEIIHIMRNNKRQDKKEAVKKSSYITLKALATSEALAKLSHTYPDVFAAYNTRDKLVNEFLETWDTNPSSPLVVPYIDSSTGQLKLCDYMRDQGLIIAGTDQADLTNFVPSPKVSWNNVQINNAMIRGFFRLTPEVTGLNIVNCDVDGAVIGCGEDYNPVVLKGSSFSYLTYSALTFYNVRCIDCAFLYPRTTTSPVFDEHFEAAINELAQPGIPTSSVLHLHRANLEACSFIEHPLSNMWADSATMSACVYDPASKNCEWAFGDADESYNIIDGLPEKGLLLAGAFPDWMNFAYTSCALYMDNINGGTSLQHANFYSAIITLTAEQDSSTLTQNLSQVDLTGGNFIYATVWFAGKPYQGLDIASLFAALGMPTDIITTMTFVAPSATQEVTSKAGMFASKQKAEERPKDASKEDKRPEEDEDKSYQGPK